jgi:L,D-peptidoglycan transpeptidase YkuD (ErfK/YbiS/YcfS/YnhG family)
MFLAVVLTATGCGSVSRATPDTTSTSTSTRTQAAGATPPAAISTIAVPATLADTTATATRTSGPQPATPCEQIAFNIGLHRPGTTQVVVVTTATAAANAGVLQVANLGPQGWQCGTEMTARLGAKGTLPLLQRRSGDGTTPAGVFPLGTMTAWDGQVFSFFGNLADPGVSAGAFRRVRTGDCFGATPGNADYGHLVQRPAAQCPGPDDEYLPAFGSVYERAALIGANMEPNVSGDAPGEAPYAAAIFLHRHSYDAAGNTRPTAGCVSLSHADLVRVLAAMRPGVLFAIGDTPWLLANT